MDEKSKILNISDKQQSQKQMNQSSENICVADNDNNNVIDVDVDVNDDNQQQTNEQHPVSNNENNNFESFKKNAVHVNDLENHWHQEVVVASKKNFTINDNMNQNSNRSIKNLPKNVTTNIIMDDKIFSSSSYKSNDKQSKQQKMCFINCLSKYNVCLQDTAELNVNNFTNLVNFIYTRK